MPTAVMSHVSFFVCLRIVNVLTSLRELSLTIFGCKNRVVRHVVAQFSVVLSVFQQRGLDIFLSRIMVQDAHVEVRRSQKRILAVVVVIPDAEVEAL